VLFCIIVQYLYYCRVGSALCDLVDNGCNPGWYQNGGFCYLFNQKKLVTQQQASDECDVFMATLLRIESGDELVHTYYELLIALC